MVAGVPGAADGGAGSAAGAGQPNPVHSDGVDKFEAASELSFKPYVPKKVKEGCAHPDPVVENGTLSTVSPPDVTYKHSLPAHINEQGLLSNVQFESVVYAGQRHQKFLAGGERAGMMVGDGAGVGKGRTLAGIVTDNQMQGRMKSVWLSVSSDLKEDAMRDFADIGAKTPCYSLSDYGYTKIVEKKGCMFVTYSMLIAKANRGKGSGTRRLDQLIAWLGDDFDGCIMFDESHKAKNLHGEKATQTGLAVLELQQRLPQARVVYCSATACSEPANMAYMVRLGLWGKGTTYADFRIWLTTVTRGGTGVMELVAMHLKTEGALLCRTLSYQGAEFQLLEDAMSAVAERQYDAAAKFWQILYAEFEKALHDSSLYTLRASKAERKIRAMQFPDEEDEVLLLDDQDPLHPIKLMETKVLITQFWGAHQRFFKSLCTILKVPAAVREAKEALKDGKCVIIGLQSTGEASINAAHKDGELNDDKSEFLSAPLKTVTRLIRTIFWYPGCDLKVNGSDDEDSGDEGGHDNGHAYLGADYDSNESEADLDDFIDDDSCDDSEGEYKPKLKKGKGKGKGKAKAAVKGKGKAKKSSAVAAAASTPVSAAVGRGKRTAARKPVKYTVDTDEEDEVSEYNDQSSDGEPSSAGKKRASPSSEQQSSSGNGNSSNSKRSKPAKRRAADSESDGEEEWNPEEDEDMLDGQAFDVKPTVKGRAGSRNSSSSASLSTATTPASSDKREVKGELSVKPEVKPEVKSEVKPGVQVMDLCFSDSDAEVQEHADDGAYSDNEDVQMYDSKSSGSSAGRTSTESSGRPDEAQEEGARAGAVDIDDEDDFGRDEKLEYAKARLAMLREKAEALSLGGSPLDTLIDHLGGTKCVAEMTGRRGRMVRGDDGKVRYQARNAENGCSLDDQNLYEKQAFQDGEKLVAIISDAASAGISLQADRRVKNQRRRVHITIELPWAADKAVQQLGRSHRANQVSAPQYKLLISQVGGEKRFASAVAKRLELLGALTQGDRRAAHGGTSSLGFGAFAVDNDYGKSSLNHIYKLMQIDSEKPMVAPPELPEEEITSISDAIMAERVQRYQRNMGRHANANMQAPTKENTTFFHVAAVWLKDVGLDCGDLFDGKKKDQMLNNVPRFLNRLLGLKISHQNYLFDYFMAVLERTVSDAKRDGVFEDGIVTITGGSVEMHNRRPVDVKLDGYGPGDLIAWEVVVDRGMPFSKVLPISEDAMTKARDAEKLAKAAAAAAATMHKSSTRNVGWNRDRYQNNRRLYTGFFISNAYNRSRQHVIFCIDPMVGAATSAVGSAGSLICFRAYRGRYSMARDGIQAYRSIEADDERIAQNWTAEFEDIHNTHQQRMTSVHVLTGKLFPLMSSIEGAIMNVENAGSKSKKVRVTIVQECGIKFDPEEEGGDGETPKTAIALRLPEFAAYADDAYERMYEVLERDDADALAVQAQKEAERAGRNGNRAPAAANLPPDAVMIPGLGRVIVPAAAAARTVVKKKTPKKRGGWGFGGRGGGWGRYRRY